MMRVLLGGALLVHGVAHLVGFVVPWRIVTSSEVPYRTTLLGADIGHAGVRALGLAWLFVSVFFVGMGANVLRHGAWHYDAILALVGVSVVLCLLGLPESRPGLLANASIGALLLLGWFLGIYPEV